MTADGRLIRTDASAHPDLFWAIRGGGGNFGVATNFQFMLHDVGMIMGGMLILPATPDVISSLVAEAEAAPEELSVIANIMVAPPMPFLPKEAHGKLVVLAMMVYAGAVEAGERAIAVFRKLAAPLADMVRPMRYPEIYKLTEGVPARSENQPAQSSSIPLTATRHRRSSTIWQPRPRPWQWRRSGCSAEQWHVYTWRQQRSHTAGDGSWRQSARCTIIPRMRTCTRSG